MAISKNFKTLSPMEILELLPHRYPFVFVDRVDGVEVSKSSPIGDRIWGTKAVSFGESFFQGHFPGRPIMPGVLSLEAISQLAIFLVWRHIDFNPKRDFFYLASVDKAKFRQPIEPGNFLKIEATLKNVKQQKFWSIEGKVFLRDVQDQSKRPAVEATVTAVLISAGGKR